MCLRLGRCTAASHAGCARVGAASALLARGRLGVVAADVRRMGSVGLAQGARLFAAFGVKLRKSLLSVCPSGARPSALWRWSGLRCVWFPGRSGCFSDGPSPGSRCVVHPDIACSAWEGCAGPGVARFSRRLICEDGRKWIGCSIRIARVSWGVCYALEAGQRSELRCRQNVFFSCWARWRGSS